MLKKCLALFIAVLMCSLTLCTTASADGYLDNNTTIEGDIADYDGLTSDKYRIMSGYVLGIKPETLVCLAADKFDKGGYVNFFCQGNMLSADDKVINNSTVAICKEGEQITPHVVALYGDVTDDDEVTVTDVATLINGIVGNVELSEHAMACADVNYDKKITASDVVAVRDFILNGTDEADKIVATNSETIYQIISHLDRIKRLGRTYIKGNDTDSGLDCSLSAAGIEFNTLTAGDIKVAFNGGTSGLNMRFRLYVDGKDLGLKSVNNDNKAIIIELPKTLAKHTIKIVQIGGPVKNGFAIKHISLNGKLTSRPLDNKKVIEIIGDSISAGCANVITIYDRNGNMLFKDTEGIITKVDINIYAKGDKTNIIGVYDFGYINLYNKGANASNPYYGTSGRNFYLSEYDAYAQYKDSSGKVLYEVPYLGSDNNDYVKYDTDASISYAVKTANILGYDYNLFAESGWALPNTSEVYDVQKPFDYDTAYVPERQSDIVLVNLFTNWPGFTDEQNLSAMETIVQKIRKNSPDSIIVFGYGAMDRLDTYKDRMDIVDNKVVEMGGADNNLYTFCFPLSRHAGGGHPSVGNNNNMAKAFAEFVKNTFE